MNAALTFVVLTLLLVVAVLAVLVWALWRNPVPVASDAQEQANAKVYREQSADLARELDLGHMGQAEYEQAMEELKRRLRDDLPDPPAATETLAEGKPRKTVIALCLLVPLCAVLLYTPEKLAQMASQLERRLQDEPGNLDAWLMLARLQRSQDNFQAAEKSFSKALALNNDDDIAVERAEVVAQIQGGDFSGEPWAVLQRILQANPNQNNALLLAGSASYSEGRFAQAVQYWERVRASLPPQSPDLNALDSALAQARDKLGPGRSPSPSPAARQQAPSQLASASNAVASPTASARISGRVSLAPALMGQANPADTVFIYATPVGGRMPLAIVRTTVGALPFDFVLDDSQAMGPQSKLSSASEVVLKARISKTGQAMAQPGEWGISLGPMPNQASQLSLVISGPMP
ncbi:MAG: c-type cytochrome biogenesis protein CcmI [Betaproteobacteria bacterium]|nr:c-type cytochrome biogenesis protein CcmI [Betaproteobacteria bacterium]